MKKLLFIIFPVLCMVACKKSNTDWPHNALLPSVADTAGNAIVLDSFPLAVGHSWTYSLQEQGSASYFSDQVFQSQYTTAIVSDTILGSFHFFKFVTTYTNNQTSEIYYWLQHNGNIYQLNTFVGFDSTAFLDSSNLVLTYPATVGDKWGYIVPSDTAGYSWNSFNKVTTAAGGFDCVKLHISLNHTLSSYSYYSTKGIVREVDSIVNPSSTGGSAENDVRMINLTSVNF